MIKTIKTARQKYLFSFQINWEFLTLCLAVIIINWPYLHKSVIPIHDTLEVFTYYHYYYSNWLFLKEIPQWFPYVTYGLPAAFFQFRNIEPTFYLTMLAGSFLRVNNALILFKCSVIAEQLIFLLGMFKLCGFLFKRKSAVFFICLCAAASITWYNGINFSFRIFYLFPFVAYLFLLFFKKHRACHFWAGCIAALLGGLGVTIYFYSLWAFVYTIFLAALFLAHGNSFKNILGRPAIKKYYKLILVLILLAGFFLFYIKSLPSKLDEIEI